MSYQRTLASSFWIPAFAGMTPQAAGSQNETYMQTNNSFSKIFFLSLITLLLFTGTDCKKEGPVTSPANPLQLTVEDATCTEAFLKLTLAENETQRTIMLKRSDSTIATITLTGKDSLFVDEGLLPNKTYSYTLVTQSFSVNAQATTMDTTSHDWTWETTTFGGTAGSCMLYDVAVINDSLAYAVGEIILPDSSGQNEIYYNALKWDGKKWTLLQILVRDFGTGAGYYPLHAVFGFSSNDVWFASDADLIQWNGTNFTSKAFFMTAIPFNGQVRKMWGTSSQNLYCVGLNGAIYHHSGTTWQKVESGTKTNINDVSGIVKTNSEEAEIYCAVTDSWEPKDKKILKITNTTNVDSIPWNIRRDIVSVWTYNGSSFYTCGDGVFKSKNNRWLEIRTIPSFFTSKIRGIAINDIVVCGSFGLISHFNGMNWKWYPELYSANGSYSSIAIRQNLIVSVGFNGSKAVVTIGKRK